jgi:DMSO/TMAO reductase YedYZ molybdopterin-dependent catalytic subunit
MAFTRGFRGRRPDGGPPRDRVPPGQYVTEDFPVLSAGPTPHARLEKWSLELRQATDMLARWSWAEFEALPQTSQTVDIHCVTKWSKLGTRWRGVTFDDLLKAAGLASPPQPYVMAHCDGGYTTNLPTADLVEGKAMVVTHFDGAPLADVHGGPARLLVPHLYFWKSAKWVRSLVFMKTNEPGFWESAGYHIHGDPWREQRYTGDE